MTQNLTNEYYHRSLTHSFVVVRIVDLSVTGPIKEQLSNTSLLCYQKECFARLWEEVIFTDGLVFVCVVYSRPH